MLRKTIDQFKGSSFLRLNAVFFVGSLIVSVLNYLYYPIIGRLLPTAAFGEVQVLVSFFMQATIFLTVVSLVIVNITVHEKNQTVVNEVIRELEKAATGLGLGLLALSLLLALPLKTAFKFESAYPFIAIAAVFVVSIPGSFRLAYLRGKQDFMSNSVGGGIGSLTKIVLSAALVLIGWRTLGAIMGILLAQLIVLAYATRQARSKGFSKVKVTRQLPQWELIRPLVPYALFVLVVSLSVTVLLTADVSIIKYLFTPEQAGLYAGIASIARIVYFLTASVATVLLSSVSNHHDTKHNVRMLARSLFLTSLLGGSTTLAFSLAPRFIIHNLMGSRYDAYAGLLPLLSLTIFTVSLANVFTSYHMALRHYRACFVVAVGVLVALITLCLHHQSLLAVVQSLCIGSLCLLTGLVVWTLYATADKKRGEVL